jgi:hypothetical protein
MSRHSVLPFAAFELQPATGELRQRVGMIKLAPRMCDTCVANGKWLGLWGMC